MKKWMKRSLVPLAVLAMALGVGTSVSKEPLELRAATETATITKANNSSYSQAIPDGELTVGTGNNHISIATTSSVNITVEYHKNKTTTNTIFNNSAGEIRLYTGSGDGGAIHVNIANQGYFFTKVTVETSRNNGVTINDGEESTSATVTETLTNRSNTLKIQNTGSGQVRMKSIEVEFDSEVASDKTLTGLEHSGTLVKTHYNAGESFDPTGLTFTARYDDGTSSDVTSFVSVPNSLTAGTTFVDVSYTEAGVTKTTRVTGITVVVPNYSYFSKITSENELHLGATYIIANASGSVAMSNTNASNNIPEVATTQNGNGDIAGTDDLTKVVLEIGVHPGTFALRAVSTNPNVNNKYLYAASSSSNYLRLQTSITVNSSWEIKFSGTQVSIIAIGSSYTRNIMRYNSQSSLFSCYSTGQNPLGLFLDHDTVNHTTAATMVANEIMNGSGSGAQGKCGERLQFLDSVLGLLTADGRNVFDTSNATLIVNARERIAYMEAWVAANPTAKGLNMVITQNGVALTATIAGVIGVISFIGYYLILKRKKRA